MGNDDRPKESRRIVIPGLPDDSPVIDLEQIEIELQGHPVTLFRIPHVQLPGVFAPNAIPMQVTLLTKLCNVLAHEARDVGDRLSAIEDEALPQLREAREKIEQLTRRLSEALGGTGEQTDNDEL